MTRAEKTARWEKHYADEVERNILCANAINRTQPVKTRPMTPEEYDEAFGEKHESCHKLKLNKGVS